MNRLFAARAVSRRPSRTAPRRSLAAAASLLGAVIALLGGCSLVPWQSSRYGGETSEVYFLNLGRDEPREVTYTLRLGTNVADLFFAFVNYGDSATPRPTVTPLSADAQHGEVGASTAARTVGVRGGVSQDAVRGASAATPIQLEPRLIADFNNNPPPFGSGAVARGTAPGDSAASRAVARISEAEGTKDTFWQYNGDFLPNLAVETWATLRRVVEDGAGNVLNVWVADSMWSIAAAATTDLVTQEKVDALADAFLKTGVDNDIRDWVTTMLGEPWGDHTYSSLLTPGAYENTIDILLLDILLDNRTDSGVVGFFWGKDNYYQTTGTGSNTDKSNERIMFYLDAPMYGQLEAGTWSVKKGWPRLVISTLAHEFQHMIHFYQKNVLRSGGQDTQRWLNEMASMITEDLVSHQMQVPGPRGVSPVTYPAGTSGAPGNREGWLPYFNADNEIGVSAWDLDDPASNYAINYGFGAFLVRNFGGAQFARELVQSPYIDEGAIQAAFDTLGYGVSYREALSQWAAAVLTSDEEIVPREDGGLEAVYNAGGWFESTIGSVTFRLGSINLFSYEIDDNGSLLTGPRIYTSEPIGSGSSQPAASVVYYQAGAALSGTLEWEITLGANTDLVVVAKAVQ